jgi:hypothetical protein
MIESLMKVLFRNRILELPVNASGYEIIFSEDCVLILSGFDTTLKNGPVDLYVLMTSLPKKPHPLVT